MRKEPAEEDAKQKVYNIFTIKRVCQHKKNKRKDALLTSLGLNLILFWSRSGQSPNLEALNLRPFLADGVKVVIPISLHLL